MDSAPNGDSASDSDNAPNGANASDSDGAPNGDNAPNGDSAPDSNGAPDQEQDVDGDGLHGSNGHCDWYDGEGPSPPTFYKDMCKEDVLAKARSWAKAHCFKVSQNGGGGGQRKLSLRCACKGRRAGPTLVQSMHGASKARVRNHSYALPGEDLCPFKLNITWGAEKGWTVPTFVPDHNHPPLPKTAVDYACRMDNLTDDHRAWIRRAHGTGLPPLDILRMFKEFHPDAPPINSVDVKNLSLESGAGTDEAHRLMQLLLKLKEADHEWFIQWQINARGQLTHLFWMSPEQRRNARDQSQILIHDNTYKTNKFGLPLGVFSGVSRSMHFHLPFTTSLLFITC